MPRDPRKYLHDIRQATERILRFVEKNSFTDYQQDDLLRSAVERQFEIIGEALAQLAKHAPSTAERIPQYRRIIAFRNVLIHGYATIDDRLVWGVVEANLPGLHREIEILLAEMSP